MFAMNSAYQCLVYMQGLKGPTPIEIPLSDFNLKTPLTFKREMCDVNI